MHSMKAAVAGTLLSGALLVTATAEEVWVTVANQDCQVDAGVPVEDGELVTWSGSCQDGRAIGLGVLQWSIDGRTVAFYEGGMLDGRLEGEGVLRMETERGDGFHRLAATFVSGEAEGDARYDAPNGDSYEGGFKNGERHGIGYYKTASGEEYFGDFEAGLRHGSGYLVAADGDVYQGGFKNNTPDGAGVFDGGDGTRYYGMFANGLPDGPGTHIEPNGDIYQGTFKAGKIDGVVLVTKSDGSQSVEQWNEGQKVK